MCTNRALVTSLECYMDDLVDCFEDFVKKSLILISVGVGSVVVMLVYMLKVLNDRTRSAVTVTASDTSRNLLQPTRSNTSVRSTYSKTSSKRNSSKSDIMLQCSAPKLTCTSVNTMPFPPCPSYNSRVLKDIGFSIGNKKCESRQPKRSVSRVSIPSLPTSTCSPKQHISTPRNCLKMLKRSSCCSMCCDDDKSLF